jgi:mRNA interferase MazF
MPSTTVYRFGIAGRVPFPFTDQTTEKRRPPAGLVELLIETWRKAGLLRPSVIKPIITTIEKHLVLRRLGRLEPLDRQALAVGLDEILGE